MGQMWMLRSGTRNGYLPILMSVLFRKEIMTMNFKWSEEEVLLLKDKYSCSTNDELIALFPNKTFLAIYKKAYSLNLKRDEEIKFLNRSKAKSGKNASNWNGGVRRTSKGYIQILMPEHKRADKGGYVMEHIVVYEKATGIEVPRNCCIHHLNGIKNDNRIENLCMMTNSAHTIYHHTGQKRSEETRKRISESKRKKYE